MSDKPHRGSIFVEEAEVLAHDAFPADQFVLRLAAPDCAAAALPGSFVHLRCDPMLPMRRPLSLMRADARGGWIECLYKAVGDGTRLLTQRQVGERINVMGPIGRPFKRDPGRGQPLLIGGGVGMPPMIFLASTLRSSPSASPFVILGSEVQFPFDPRPSQLVVPGLPAGVIGAMPLLDDWGIPSRLASLQGFPGCHDGYVTDLARQWLDGLGDDARAQVEIFACGPHPMLAAVAALARDYDLPCQVSLEEYMACGVGGCAGCVVQVQTSDGPAMKRVCVDGPVFDARQVFA